ncbi:MAG: VOC family protein [Usitatibacter sp.]
MKQTLGLVSLLVRDYDEAIAFYVGILGFELVEDTPIVHQAKRWVVVAPTSGGAGLVLARAAGREEEARIGNQAGGRVFLFLRTDDFARDYRNYKSRGVTFVRAPREEPYGRVAVFEDLYGNLWDLVQVKSESGAALGPGARNVEIKARVRDLGEVEDRARAVATEGPVDLVQDDTFFTCANGRLKLRQFADGRGELIHYLRADDAGPKTSEYRIIPTTAPEALRETLSRALGAAGRVRKARRLYIADRTRIHLDDVEDLGPFVELEVVLREGESAESGNATAWHMMSVLGISESQLVREAYVELQRARGEVAVATVAHIFVAAAKAAPPRAVETVEALTDQGLRGDRYAEAANRRAPDQQVTLIELENMEAFTHATGLPLTPDMPRRNIVTRGARLNELIGRRFAIGDAVFEGLQLCEPCKLFAQRTHPEALSFFAGKGGLRARIVAGGTIRVGDPLTDKRLNLARKSL